MTKKIRISRIITVRRQGFMKPTFKLLTAIVSLAAVTLGAQAAVAAKSGGILKAYQAAVQAASGALPVIN